MTDDSLETFLQPLFIQKNVSLASYNTFRFEHKAQYFAEIDSLDLLTEALRWAKHIDIPVTVIGGGSNLLISDEVLGLVLVNRLMGKTAEVSGDSVLLQVSSGENWHQLVAYTVEHQWYGIENLALIPGTVGAAPVQNIGAYGVEVKDVLTRVQVLDVMSEALEWLTAESCGFAYRDSHFKGLWQGRYIITAVEMQLHCLPSYSLNYGGLKQQIQGEVTLAKVFDAVCAVRQSKLPDPAKLANAGSFFKNPIVNAEQHEELKRRFPNLVSFPFGEAFKLAAGWLIDQSGWKGVIHKGVGVYDKQALVLVNYSEHKADALLELESKIKQSVLDKYGVFLEREPVKLPAVDAMASIVEGGIQ
ncbi:UDP-N-acetylenolpyruvoylglucosamine reductase [Marinomonas spartinae]|uniref:UDP-N-acetylmuramate dehydrogenase n=1 Tax=Marinomonas spartinae TaxID=1792290 RepID=UPI0008091360|nr:UDP-N-acetylmuramate dehydrogenase [Marinomonas spartinae]SBS37640.1 UDP-N-acetylenolpyruvoylglucosamine reductase [Marinomonas spartinae]